MKWMDFEQLRKDLKAVTDQVEDARTGIMQLAHAMKLEREGIAVRVARARLALDRPKPNVAEARAALDDLAAYCIEQSA